jgi:tetratricopeptide (TPR) repeat protein
MIPRSRFRVAGLLAGFALALSCAAASEAQDDPTRVGDPNFSSSAFIAGLRGPGSNVVVSVRESTGFPVSASATVRLSCPLAGLDLTGPARGTSAQIQFLSVPVGDCNIEVNAQGYKPYKDHAEVVPSMAAVNQYVYVYLHPESEPAAGARPAIVPEKALKEIDRGMAAMQNKHDAEALKHLTKASQLAPANADVAYLLGVLALNGNDLAAAGQHFQTAVSYAPAHGRALVELGYVQVATGQWNAAVQTLEKSLQVNMASSRAHLLLANAYGQLHNYAKAQEHAQRAEEFGSENAGPARTLLAEILAAQGNRDGAKAEFEAVVRDFTNSASAALAKQGLENLSHSNEQVTAEPSLISTAPVAGADAVLLPKMSAVTATAWAPPSVDTSVPGVAPDVACSAEDVIARTSTSTNRQLENLEKFLATEHIQHEEVNGRGEVTQIRDKNFSYMVFIEHAKDGLVFLDEKRDGGTGTDSFPTSLATMGLVSLGVDVFHPGFAKALDFKCEGLGQWRGKAAWILYFEQKGNVKSFLRLWQTKTKTVEVPLKGRVWVAASSYNVLHVESDLREPMKELELMRDHLAIDYGPVNFQIGKTELWLPWYADMYLELHGKRYHHNHTLSNFSLFAVDTNDKISLPKDVPPQENPKQPPQADNP